MTTPPTHATDVLRRWIDDAPTGATRVIRGTLAAPVTASTQVIQAVATKLPASANTRFLSALHHGSNIALVLGALITALALLNQAFLPLVIGFTVIAGGFAATSLECLIDPDRLEHIDRAYVALKNAIERRKR